MGLLGPTLSGLLGPAPGYSFGTLFGLFRGSRARRAGRPCVGRGQLQFMRPPVGWVAMLGHLSLLQSCFVRRWVALGTCLISVRSSRDHWNCYSSDSILKSSARRAFPRNSDLFSFLFLPSGTNLLLTKNFSEIILFVKITNFTRNSLKKSFFPGNLESATSLKNYKKNSRGVIFVIISCQRVFFFCQTGT